MNRKEFFTVARQTFKEFGKDDVGLLSAGLTYYAFFSVFPLLLLTVSLANLLLSPEDAMKFVFSTIEQFVPGSAAVLVDAVQNAFDNQESAGWRAIVSLAILAYSASGAFSTLDRALNRAWGSEKVPTFVARKLASFVMMLVGAGLLLLSLVASTLLAYSRSFALEVFGEVRGMQIFWQVASIGLSLALVFVVFLLVYRYVPRSDVRLEDVWLSALLAAIAWVLLKEGFALYLGSQFADYNAIYGTMGTVIALLTWIYLSSVIILTGAEFASETQHVRRLHEVLVEQAMKPQEMKETKETNSPWFS